MLQYYIKANFCSTKNVVIWKNEHGLLGCIERVIDINH